jgi:hypothetical protein
MPAERTPAASGCRYSTRPPDRLPLSPIRVCEETTARRRKVGSNSAIIPRKWALSPAKLLTASALGGQGTRIPRLQQEQGQAVSTARCRSRVEAGTEEACEVCGHNRSIKSMRAHWGEWPKAGATSSHGEGIGSEPGTPTPLGPQGAVWGSRPLRAAAWAPRFWPLQIGSSHRHESAPSRRRGPLKGVGSSPNPTT